MGVIESAGGIVLNPYSEVLVITNQIGKRTFPKGRPTPNELSADTARREIGEESGLRDIRIARFLGVIVRPGFTEESTNIPSVTKAIHMYLAYTFQLDLCPTAADAVRADWVAPDDLSKVLYWPEELAFFEDWRAALKL